MAHKKKKKKTKGLTPRQRKLIRKVEKMTQKAKKRGRNGS